MKSIGIAAVIWTLLIVLSCGVVAQDATAEATVTKKVLDNGLTVLVKPEPGSGLVAVAAFVRAGAAQESIQNAGIGNFVSNLVLASTKLSSAEEISAVANEVGGNIGARWSPDFSDIRIVTTSAKFNDAMTLIGECLTEANFEEKWVEQVRSDLLSRTDSGPQDMFERAYDKLRAMLYEDSGYARPVLGFERTLRLAKPADLQKFYQLYYVPNNVIISIVGDVTVEQALDRASKAFSGVIPRQLPVNRGMPDEKLERSKLHAEEAELSRAYLMLGWLVPPIGHPDYPAMAVAANALGGGKGSLMFREIRRNMGIYDLGTFYPQHQYQSHLIAYVFIPDPYRESVGGVKLVLEEVKAAVVEQVEKLKTNVLSEADLERAKGYTIGSYALQHQHLLDRAYYLGWLETIGVGYEYDRRFAEEVAKLTAGDVQQAARKYLTNYAAVLLLPKT